MVSLHIEGETFETLFVPLNEKGTPGVDLPISFIAVSDNIEARLTQRETSLWEQKIAQAKLKGVNLTNGKQYGLMPNSISSESISNGKLTLPVSEITYSRIELAKEEKSKDIPNVLALSEIIEGMNGYLFVQRGEKLAYHGQTGQLHALVAGNYPQNINFVCPQDMSVNNWFNAQQETEQGIMYGEVYERHLLGIVLDKTLGYKPDLVYTAKVYLNKEGLSKSHPVDAWEKKGVIETPSTEKDLRNLILEHSEINQHVPPGYAGAILELARAFGLEALERLNYEGKKGSAQLIEYSIIQ